VIETSDVVFAYAQTPVLQGISLQVREGEMTAVVGPSGSGKSTLLGVISGDLRGFSGKVSIDGEPVGGKGRPVGLAQIYQDYRLVPFVNACANVSLGVELRESLGSKEVASRSASALEAVGLSGKIRSLPVNLSGGEQQRLAIARAIATRPRYLLADEPTGCLDAENSTQIGRLLLQIARSQRVGVLVATHDPLVSGLADEVVSIRDGRVVSASV
jgi:putative ABC transport system ATP-binding protein